MRQGQLKKFMVDLSISKFRILENSLIDIKSANSKLRTVLTLKRIKLWERY